MKRIVFFIVFIIVGCNFTKAQNDNAISITVTNDVKFIKTEKSLQENVVEFSICGISSEDGWKAFSEKIKNYRGVLKFELFDTGKENQKNASATFYSYANKKYLCGLMEYCGVRNINYQNNTYTLEEFKVLKIHSNK